jgi:formylglycine-generating enzyme required for sulfatase activity
MHMRVSLGILGLILLGALTARAQHAGVIQSAELPGQIVFEPVPGALGYRVEWASMVGGAWTNFAAASLLLDDIPNLSSGPITASVPMLFRVVAVTTNPPFPDFTVSHVGTSAYLINGESNPTLVLTRGQTYVLEIDAFGYPLWIKTAPTIGVGDLYTNGVINNGIMEGEITFTVPSDAPTTLYYISQFQFAMQGVIDIVDGANPQGMALIPSGSFAMGNPTNIFLASEGVTNELPQHTVNVRAFYMDIYEVTKALWDEVRTFNSGNGYSLYIGDGKDPGHPVINVNWYEALKWCNARSELEGLTPVYYTDANLTMLYKSGQVHPFVDWNANGYRLPTEAEWEKAARGGVADTRFPWTDYTNRISWAKANYYGAGSFYSYDLNGTIGEFSPYFQDAVFPYTSPVGYFAPNGYGLYDMAGNTMEWCWDNYQADYYASSPSNDPRGPAGSLLYRVMRGGSWQFQAVYARIAFRSYADPTEARQYISFRCVRGL